MGLTSQSTGLAAFKDTSSIIRNSADDIIIALAGNPNTGKSTVFNSLTGLNQHTGNWTGKTVATAQGNYKFKDKNFILVDLPGTYSLLSSSVEEEVARDFICFGNPKATVIVTDATCLERNLNLVLQILEITDRVVICVNLIDEANRKKITIDIDSLSKILGVPVVATNARDNNGLDDLMEAVYKVSVNQVDTKPIQVKYSDVIENSIKKVQIDIEEICKDKLNSRWAAIKIIDGDSKILESINKYLGIKYSIYEKSNLNCNSEENSFRDEIVFSIVKLAEVISNKVIHLGKENYNEFDKKIDDILTSKKFGIPIMLMLLGIIFYITIEGANVPSEMISKFLFGIEEKLTKFFLYHNLPNWLHGVLILGMYRTLAWVISVMLPPMAIFFPLFTLLEDLGYLPRVAFNLDNFFKKACAHGKQALTMCMGFGCNAAGVIGCRIIDSPRERLIAIITNNFVPCNGRFPTLIAITSIFIATSVSAPLKGVISSLTITAAILIGVATTLLISKILSKTILKGMPSSFTLELPPYRKPQIGKILVRSVLDRTLFVLGRAIIVAAPAGIITWIMANINIGSSSLLTICANFLNPFAHLIGVDGYILMGFILGLPANEIVMPIIIMSYMSTGYMIELDNINALREVLLKNGWTFLTAINVMILCLMHYPCSTTLLTIKKETQSIKWTIVSFLVPTLTGILTCFILTQVIGLLS